MEKEETPDCQSFVLNKDTINTADVCDTGLEDISNFGIKAYNQNDFEDGVLAQLDKAANQAEKSRLQNIISKELQEKLKLIKENEEKLSIIKAVDNKFKKDLVDKLQLLKQNAATLKYKLQRINELDSDEEGELLSNIIVGNDDTEPSHSNRARKRSADHKRSLEPSLPKKPRTENIFDQCSKSSRSKSPEFCSNKKLSFPALKHNFSEDHGNISDHEEYDDVIYENNELMDDQHEFHEDRETEEEFAKSVVKKNNITTKTRRFEEQNYTKDDGNIKLYQERLRLWEESERKAQIEAQKRGEDLLDCSKLITVGEGGYEVPAILWNQLYDYQRNGVKWLHQLHVQKCGGIVGDEMGLGKTIQTITFLTGLRQSKKSDGEYTGLGPVLVVCPATVMHQWVREFHKWWPPFRVAILHNSGSFSGSQKSLVTSLFKSRGVLVTSYSQVTRMQSLSRYNWHYVVLDEGHKIRNPDAQVTTACKQFTTCHRLILSGSPVQNNLRELWSLFDFIFPGRLGTMADFMSNFSVPIVQGGYANASQLQVQTAYKCACVLRDTINPYLLRRMKADVKHAANLPDKNEQVLFCRLSAEQRDLYTEYLESKECQQILKGEYMIFPGLITLRKICNHPDLSTGGPHIFKGDDIRDDDVTMRYGWWKRSGKMVVLDALLRIWKRQNNRVLVFTQSRQMLDILQTFMRICEHSYLRMDGSTPIATRQPMIKKYNEDSAIFVFLLTTRVGGLGVNLTGANRVVIFDPDWNPSTDTQARERAWRIGQLRDVTIYRFVTAGTVEEKIYHRQIFKQFLTNRVLKDPKQRRFFKSNDLFELFTLNDDNPSKGTETAAIFAGTGSNVSIVKKRRKNRFDKINALKKEQQNSDKPTVSSSNLQIDQAANCTDCEKKESTDDDVDKVAKMRRLAKEISQKISRQKARRENGGDESEELKLTTETDGSFYNNEQLNEKRREKKKKRKKHKNARFDGEKVKNLVRQCTHESEPKDSAAQDAYVLKKLLKKTVHSALQHDAIVQSSDPDFALVEAEAERVARDAANALAASREKYKEERNFLNNLQTDVAASTSKRPRFGAKSSAAKAQPSTHSALFNGDVAGSSDAANPESTPMSSATLLEKMRHRNNAANHDSLSPNSELLDDIRNFLAFQANVSGQASTEEILDRFKKRIPQGNAAIFKALLKQLAVFRSKQGIGIWRLKPQYR